MIERYGHDKLRLLECPACGYDLKGARPSVHIATHSPSDFGIENRGESV